MRRKAYFVGKNQDGEPMNRFGYLIGFTRNEGGSPLAIFEHEIIGRMELMDIEEVELINEVDILSDLANKVYV